MRDPERRARSKPRTLSGVVQTAGVLYLIITLLQSVSPKENLLLPLILGLHPAAFRVHSHHEGLFLTLWTICAAWDQAWVWHLAGYTISLVRSQLLNT